MCTLSQKFNFREFLPMITVPLLYKLIGVECLNKIVCILHVSEVVIIFIVLFVPFYLFSVALCCISLCFLTNDVKLASSASSSPVEKK